jgi:glucan 1,3-beta-glucosidase
MLGFSVFTLLLPCAYALDARSYATIPPYPTTKPTSVYGGSPAPTGGACASYWLEDIKHQGLASFNPNATHLPFGWNSTYQVFRNVKDYGAVGDGRTDDTAAIQRAISDGFRCGPGCQSSTQTPAVVYLPAGTYLISASIVDYYYTQVRILV